MTTTNERRCAPYASHEMHEMRENTTGVVYCTLCGVDAKTIEGELKEEIKKKDAEITSLRKQLAEGIHLRGWWCNAPVVTSLGVMTTCDRFNGEEKDKHISCRYCGALKGLPYQPGA